MAEICSKCRSVACAKSRATVVLPVPGGPQNTRLPSERVDSMRVSAPSGPSRWSCPDHLVELLRAQAVGERARRVLVEAGGGEQRGPRFGARGHGRPSPGAVHAAGAGSGFVVHSRVPAHRCAAPGTRGMQRAASSAEHRGDLPAAAAQDDAPGAVRLGGDAREVARLLDALIVHRHDDVAAPEADIAGIGAVIDVEDDDAVVGVAQLQFVGQRRRQIGDLGAGERRARADGDLVARHIPARCARPP